MLSLTPDALRDVGIKVPDLPDKVFFSISEVSDICRIEPHVLRYWETEFSQIKPVKRGGNRRLYRQRDVCAVLCVQHLMHHLHFTTKGARKRMNQGDLDAFVEQPDIYTSLQRIRARLLEAKALLVN